MDFKQIQELIKTINKSNIGELSIEDKDFKITIKQRTETAQQFAPGALAAPALPAPLQTVNTLTASSTSGISDAATPALKADNFITIKSPMIGTFYRRPSPDKPLLAEAGDVIAPGKVVCIIEAMKLFNEIESEISGTIVKALVEDASPVEFDQPLFLVEPN